MTLADICRCLGRKPDVSGAGRAALAPTGAAVDSRAVKGGDIFFCLPGERVDGHDYAAAAVAAGAVAVVAARDPFGGASPVPLLLAPDPAAALMALAACHRDRARAVVVGVTGTSGKTSVKETLASVMSRRGKTEKTPMNLNNQIGLPLSLLNADPDADFWVMEAGISKPRDMDELGAILRPDLALILNAGAGHTQELGDRGTAHYKSRLLAHLAPRGTAVVSADYPDLVREAASHGRTVVHFSARAEAAPYWAEYTGPVSDVLGGYRLHMPGEILDVAAPFQGAFGCENVAAVAAAAHGLGLGPDAIRAGLEAAKLPDQRFNAQPCGAFLLIDDSYNANPLSMRRMVDAAAESAARRGGELLLVLGEMGELGPESDARHAELGAHLATLAPAAVIWKGGRADAVAGGLRGGGFNGPFLPVSGDDDFRRALASLNLRGGVALFKGSRSNTMEMLVAVFKETVRAAGAPDSPRSTGVTGAAGAKGGFDAL